MEARKNSTFVFIVFVIMLGGCTTTKNTEPTKSSIITESPSPPLSPSAPCVYESTKGVAEVIELSLQQVTFKFYPGDQVFTLPTNTAKYSDMSLEQELKAIIRVPLSGPCEETEFELLSTIE